MKWGKKQDRNLENVEDQPDETLVVAEGQEEIAYELHEWAGETRLILDQLLTLRDIPHVWQGATLVIRESDEEETDQLIEEAESTVMPVFDVEAETVIYETTGWGDSERNAFGDLLGRLGVPHEFNEESDLVVQAVDEEAVETALDTFQLMNDERPELMGLDANTLLTEAFVACDRLRRDPRDDAGVGELLRLGPVLVGHRSPFGIDVAQWDEIGNKAESLIEILSEGSADQESTSLLAGELAEILRSLS
tara:strand:+ start:546 stop:1295 length:750 start_codon:yes stop_codon:yes gene_type:complete